MTTAGHGCPPMAAAGHGWLPPTPPRLLPFAAESPPPCLESRWLQVAAQNGHGAAADWWSLGVLVFQCLTLCTPFEGPTAHATIQNIIHGRRVPPANPGALSESASAFIDALLHPDPAERLGGSLRANVTTNRFFWGFDFTQLEKRQMTPPHAARCRARAVKATQHPALALPPLPDLDDLSHGRGDHGDAAAPAVPRPVAAATLELDRMERGPRSPPIIMGCS